MKPGMRHRPARSSISNPGLRIASAPCLDPVCKKCIEPVSLSSIHDDEGDYNNGDSPTTVSNDLSLSDNAINVLRIRAVHGENFPPMVENLEIMCLRHPFKAILEGGQGTPIRYI